MKYFFFVFTILSSVLGIFFFLNNDLNALLLCLVSAITSGGVCEILSQLQKNNEGVIVRDPKTGRFTKKC